MANHEDSLATQRCQDGSGQMRCPCKKQLGLPGPQRGESATLVTHQEIARVWKFGDIRSFGLNQAGSSTFLPDTELFLVFFFKLSIGSDIEKVSPWIMLQAQLKISQIAYFSCGLVTRHTKKDGVK